MNVKRPFMRSRKTKQGTSIDKLKYKKLINLQEK